MDLDATVSFLDWQYIGCKCSSAYIPPEMITILEDKNKTAVIRTYETDCETAATPDTASDTVTAPATEPVTSTATATESATGGLPYEPLYATPEYDMWSL
eukprot:gene43230-57527_t